MAIMTAQEFRNRATSIIEIPGFDSGETFEIKVKKLSIVGLISSGKIPNSLMKVVKDAFSELKSSNMNLSDTAENEDEDSRVMDRAGDIGKLLDIVCSEAMIEPRFEDIKDVMNDAQKLAVFQFTQGGVESVTPFPEVAGDSGHLTDVENVSSPTE